MARLCTGDALAITIWRAVAKADNPVWQLPLNGPDIIRERAQDACREAAPDQKSRDHLAGALGTLDVIVSSAHGESLGTPLHQRSVCRLGSQGWLVALSHCSNAGLGRRPGAVVAAGASGRTN